MCPGETLANVEIFLFLASLLQKYHVLPEEGQVIDINVPDVTLADLWEQKLRFLPR